MRPIRAIIWILIPVVCTGCAKLGNLDKLLTLKDLADHQEATDAHVEEREQIFRQMITDVEGGQVQPGTVKQEILSRYGDPIFVEYTQYQDQVAELWMYRMPVKFTGSDQVYLYFDAMDQVIAYEVKRQSD